MQNNKDYEHCKRSIIKVATKLNTPIRKLRRIDYRRHKNENDASERTIGEKWYWRDLLNKVADDLNEYEEPDPSEIISEYRSVIKNNRYKSQVKILKNRIIDLEDSLETLIHLKEQVVHIPRIERREKKSGLREGTAVALFSDTHIEETVNPREIGNLNEYDLQIAINRFCKYTDSLLWMLNLYESRYLVRDLIFWLGGDHISGYIHDELVENNQLTPIEATLHCQELISAEIIDRLLQETALEQIIIPCNVGNHARTTKRIQHNNGVRNSYEWLMFQMLRQKYAKEPRIIFNVSEGGLLYQDVYDLTLRFTHGNYIRYFGGIGGPLTPIEKAIKNWDVSRKAHITNIGHFHSYMDTPRCVMNGSLIGYNAFAQAIKAPYSPPEQAMYLIDSKRGKRLSTALWVD